MLNIAQNIENSQESHYIEYVNSDKYMYVCEYIPVFDMYLVNKININTALSEYNPFQRFQFLAF